MLLRIRDLTKISERLQGEHVILNLIGIDYENMTFFVKRVNLIQIRVIKAFHWEILGRAAQL